MKQTYAPDVNPYTVARLAAEAEAKKPWRVRQASEPTLRSRLGEEVLYKGSTTTRGGVLLYATLDLAFAVYVLLVVFNPVVREWSFRMADLLWKATGM